jgi:putative transposase
VHPTRVPHFPYTGIQRYFLTLCTENRRRVFVCEPTVSAALEHFRQSAARHGFANLAYCFMPDHLHLLFEACREDANLCPCVSDAKQRSGFAFRRSAAYRLWQTGYYDHVLRDEESVFAVVRYILENPVRAGFASRLGEYKFCGSDVYSMDEILACPEIWSPIPRSGRRR